MPSRIKYKVGRKYLRVLSGVPMMNGQDSTEFPRDLISNQIRTPAAPDSKSGVLLALTDTLSPGNVPCPGNTQQRAWRRGVACGVGLRFWSSLLPH